MKKNLIFIIIILLVALLFLKVYKQEKYINTSNNDWIVVPEQKIGPLDRESVGPEKDILFILKKKFGDANVSQTEFSVGEGISIPAYTIYAGTENEIQIHVSNKSILVKIPSYNSYFDFNSDLSSKIKWKLNNGIEIGSSLEEVEKINGKSFEISGFEWDYPGVVNSWSGGNLPKELSLVFTQTSLDKTKNYEEITGDKLILSDNLVLKETKPVVSFIYIKWDY